MITEEIRKEIIEDYKLRENWISNIAHKRNLSYESVRRVLVEDGYYRGRQEKEDYQGN